MLPRVESFPYQACPSAMSSAPEGTEQAFHDQVMDGPRDHSVRAPEQSGQLSNMIPLVLCQWMALVTPAGSADELIRLGL